MALVPQHKMLQISSIVDDFETRNASNRESIPTKSSSAVCVLRRHPATPRPAAQDAQSEGMIHVDIHLSVPERSEGTEVAKMVIHEATV